MEERDSAYKRHIQNLTRSGTPEYKQQFEQSLGQTCLLILEGLLGAGGNCSSGDTDSGGRRLGSLFYHVDTGAGKCRVESSV